MIKRSSAEDYDVRSRKYPALSLKKGDALLDIRLAPTDDDILLISRDGMSIRFPLSGVPVQGRIAAGVRAMSVEATDEVIWFSQLSEKDEVILFSERGWAKRIPQLDFESQNRGGKGVRCFYFNKNGSNGRVIAGILLSARDVPAALLVTQVRSPMTRLDKAEILLQNRQGKGMPYLMAILDDIVTALYGIETVPETPQTNP